MRQKRSNRLKSQRKSPTDGSKGFLSFDVLQSSRLLAVLPSNSYIEKQQAYVNPINLKTENRLQKIWRYLSLRLTNFQTGSANRKKEIENDRNRNHKNCARCYKRINRNNWNSHSLKKIRIRCFPKYLLLKFFRKLKISFQWILKIDGLLFFRNPLKT